MRLLYIVHQFFPEFGSGTERVTLNLARMAQRAGHRVEVLTCVLNPAALTDGVPGPFPGTFVGWIEGVRVVYLDRGSLPLLAEASFDVDAGLRAALAAWMLERQFDVAHLMHSMRMATAIAAVQDAQLPLVVSLTDFHPLCLRTNLIDAAGLLCPGPARGAACTRRCPLPGWDADAMGARHQQTGSWLAHAAARIAPSPFVAARYAAEFPELPVRVIPHGVEGLRYLDGLPARPPLCEGVRLLFVGSVIEIKGLHTVLEALRQRPGLALRLDVVGGVHGEAVFQQRIKRLLEADARVVWHGQQTQAQIRQLMAQAHALLLPSLVPESFSLALHEGFAAGLPALVSDLGAPAQTVGEMRAGLVLPAGDGAAWGEALERIVQSPALLDDWARCVLPPLRLEEEAFLTESLYWDALSDG